MKDIEEHREILQGIATESMEEAVKIIIECHEEIVIAFMAKYKLSPEDVITCHEGNKFWVEKRDDEHIIKMTEGRIKSYNNLLDVYKKLLGFINSIITNFTQAE